MSKIHAMAMLLRDLSEHVSEENKLKIEDVLDDVRPVLSLSVYSDFFRFE